MFLTAAQLGIKTGDTMLMNSYAGPVQVKVLSTETLPCTKNWIAVQDQNGRTYWRAADGLKKI